MVITEVVEGAYITKRGGVTVIEWKAGPGGKLLLRRRAAEQYRHCGGESNQRGYNQLKELWWEGFDKIRQC